MIQITPHGLCLECDECCDEIETEEMEERAMQRVAESEGWYFVPDDSVETPPWIVHLCPACKDSMR